MAKKTKNAEAEDEAPAAEGEAPAPPPAKSRKLLIAGIAAAVVALGGGGAFYVFGGGHSGEANAAPKPAVFVDIREMTVNLAQGAQDRAQYLKIKVALEVSDAKLVAAIQPLMPRIEDAFQVYVRELRPSDLEGSAGVYRLKEELLRRVNMAVYPSRVDAVLFKEIVVQ